MSNEHACVPGGAEATYILQRVIMVTQKLETSYGYGYDMSKCEVLYVWVRKQKMCTNERMSAVCV